MLDFNPPRDQHLVAFVCCTNVHLLYSTSGDLIGNL